MFFHVQSLQRTFAMLQAQALQVSTPRYDKTQQYDIINSSFRIATTLSWHDARCSFLYCSILQAQSYVDSLYTQLSFYRSDPANFVALRRLIGISQSEDALLPLSLPYDLQIGDMRLSSKPAASAPIASLAKGASMAKAASPILTGVTHATG